LPAPILHHCLGIRSTEPDLPPGKISKHTGEYSCELRSHQYPVFGKSFPSFKEDRAAGNQYQAVNRAHFP